MPLCFFPKLTQRASIWSICAKQMNCRTGGLQRQSSIIFTRNSPVSHAANRKILPDCHLSHPPVHSVVQRLCGPSITYGDVVELLKTGVSDTQPARLGSTSGMSGAKTPSLGDAFSDENKERVMSSLSSKLRTLRRFYTKDVKQRGAVVVPLCSVNGEPCILFTLRTRTLKDHSGEVRCVNVQTLEFKSR